MNCKTHFVFKALIGAYLRMGTAAFAANTSKQMQCNSREHTYYYVGKGSEWVAIAKERHQRNKVSCCPFLLITLNRLVALRRTELHNFLVLRVQICGRLFCKGLPSPILHSTKARPHTAQHIPHCLCSLLFLPCLPGLGADTFFLAWSFDIYLYYYIWIRWSERSGVNELQHQITKSAAYCTVQFGGVFSTRFPESTATGRRRCWI